MCLFNSLLIKALQKINNKILKLILHTLNSTVQYHTEVNNPQIYIDEDDNPRAISPLRITTTTNKNYLVGSSRNNHEEK